MGLYDALFGEKNLSFIMDEEGSVIPINTPGSGSGGSVSGKAELKALTQYLSKKIGIGVPGVDMSNVDIHSIANWARNFPDGRAQDFGYGVSWGLRTQRFNNGAETALQQPIKKVVALMAETMLNYGGGGQQGIVNYLNKKFSISK